MWFVYRLQIFRFWIITRDDLFQDRCISSIVVTLGRGYQRTSPSHLPHHFPKGSIVMNISVIMVCKLAKVADSTVFFWHSDLFKYRPQLVLFTSFLPSLEPLSSFKFSKLRVLLMHLWIKYARNDQLRVWICA